MKDYIVEFLKLKLRECLETSLKVIVLLFACLIILFAVIGCSTMIGYIIHLLIPEQFIQLSFPNENFIGSCIQTGLTIVFLIGFFSATFYGLFIMLFNVVSSLKEDWSLAKSNVKIRRGIARAKN